MNHIQNKNLKHRPITYKDFRVFNKDGSLKKGVIKAYLKDMEITITEFQYDKIQIDGQWVEPILHPEALKELKEKGKIKAIVSVQFRQCGHYAIAELKHSSMKEKQC